MKGPEATALCKCLSDERHKETAGAVLASQGLRLKTRKSGRPAYPSFLLSTDFLVGGCEVPVLHLFAKMPNLPVLAIFLGRQDPAHIPPNAVTLCTKMLVICLAATDVIGFALYTKRSNLFK